MTKTLYAEKDGLEYYHITESDGSNPLYYRFKSYDNMISYLMENDASNVDYVYEKTDVPYMRLNLSNDKMFYSNFSLVFDDTTPYYEKNVYTVSETVTVTDKEPYLVDEFTSDFIATGLSSEFIGVLPIVIPLIVLYIALHKGIRFMFNFIRSA